MAKCSTPFHSSRSELAILEASHAFLLTCRQFEPSLGTATKALLHRRSRVTMQVSWGDALQLHWVLELVKQPTCSCDNKFGRLRCQRSGRLWQENWAAFLLSLPDVQCNQLHPSSTRCPTQPAASLLYQMSNATSCIPPITTRCLSGVIELSDPPCQDSSVTHSYVGN